MFVPIGYTLADLKAAILGAVLDKATDIGLTVVASDVDVLGLESFAP